jgi:hypothetical protein
MVGQNVSHLLQHPSGVHQRVQLKRIPVHVIDERGIVADQLGLGASLADIPANGIELINYIINQLID